MRRRALLAAAAGAALAPGLAHGAVAGSAAYFAKMAAFDAPDRFDVYVEEAARGVLDAVVARLSRVQDTVGFGTFAVLGFDEMARTARGYPSIGAFPRVELDFLERVFFGEASRFGFRGRKVVARLTDAPKTRQLAHVHGEAGHLFDGRPLETFRRMHAQVGPDLVLTSGVRGVVTQFHLFLRKAQRTDGNLSLASRSLAPSGYSYHGVGDFDVGQRGFGRRNFTADLAATEVHRRLEDPGYLRVRYPRGNLLGVRCEPWHIRVVP